jgi:hypothetical protein
VSNTNKLDDIRNKVRQEGNRVCESCNIIAKRDKNIDHCTDCSLCCEGKLIKIKIKKRT